MKIKTAIIGSGNIGTDLLMKIMRLSDVLEVAALVGIDAESDGLKRAADLGVPTTYEGIEGLVAMPDFTEIAIVFDATSAGAHRRHEQAQRGDGDRGHRARDDGSPTDRATALRQEPRDRVQRDEADGRLQRERRHPLTRPMWTRVSYSKSTVPAAAA